MTKSTFMVDKVYTDLFGYRQKATISVADFVDITGYTGSDPAGALAARVKPGLSMVAVVKDDSDVVLHRPVTFGAGGCLEASWKTDKDGNQTHLVVELVSAPTFWNSDLEIGRLPVNIIRKASNNGKRKLAEHLQAALDTAIWAAPTDTFGSEDKGPIMHLTAMGFLGDD